MKKVFKKLIKKRVIIPVIAVLLIFAITPFIVNQAVISSAEKYIITEDEATILSADCILVLGCFVYSENNPSPMLYDRINQGISLYHKRAAPKLLMSGDHGQHNYDEVNTMKNQAINNGVPSEDVFMDHAGFSTYDSMYRARDVFEVKKVIIVTQRYHLSRALYIARALGLEAYGVASDPRRYTTEKRDNLREFMARNKDFASSIIKPKPKYLGERIPITGNGDITND